MPGVTQTIDTYHAGMSQQPDLKKFPGQVKNIINAIPDPTDGLYKRPGSKRISPTEGESYHDEPLTNVQSNGSWFHYYRDDTEGSYIGQIASDGTTRIWSCNDGDEKTVIHGAIPWVASTAYVVGDLVENGGNIYTCDTAGTSAGSGGPSGTGANITDGSTRWDYVQTQSAATTSIKNYLTPSSATATEDIQALTINDTTFLNNRTKTVGTTGTTAGREHDHFAYIDLLRTENGRQYALNIYSDETTNTTIKRATRVKISSTTQNSGGGTGHCPGIGTQVFSVTAAASYSGTSIVSVKNSSGTNITTGRDNLIFRITSLGQQGSNPSGNFDDASLTANEYICSYNNKVELLHGGEGWEEGDKVTVTLDQAVTDYNFEIKIEKIEATEIKANIKAVRPDPTPFDADTAVTVDTIIGGITSELSGTSPAINYKIIGNGLYLHASSAFSVEVVDRDLMRIMQDQINDVAELPNQCLDGYIIKVANSKDSSDDDYYLKFEGNNGLDGPGAWVECPAPGIVKSLNDNTMPHVLQRQADGKFLVRKYVWEDRLVGDDNTNPLPTFADGSSTINKVLFHRNRLAILSGENVILSRPGELAVPSFFAKTALTVSAIDPIDISSSSEFPSSLFDGVEITSGLLVFSTNQQFLLSSDAEILNPDTAKLRSVSTYNYNKNIPPISLGLTVGYIDNSGKYSRFNEMANTQREGEPTVIETSKLVPTLLPKDIDLITNSRENQLVMYGKTGTDIVYLYKYLQSGETREQTAWFKWKLNNPIKYHFIIDDNYYLLDTDNFLQKISLMQEDADPSIDETIGSETTNYLIHLDNWTTVANGSYSSTSKTTTFANQSDWIDQVTTPNGNLVLVDIDSNTHRVGRYSECTVTNTDDFTVPGNWEWSDQWEITSVGSIAIDTNKFTLTSGKDHGLQTNDKVKWVQGATQCAPLVDGTIYYAIRTDENIIQLAATSGGAAIDITDAGTGTHKLSKIYEQNYYIGYLYDYSVDFPTIYPLQIQGQQAKADVNSSVTIHRLKFNFGKSGLYTTTLVRDGKADYVETYEAPLADEYLASDAPYVPDSILTVPVYENTNNVKISLSSSHPAPATLHAMSWEGDYTPKNYKRV
mgnify:CR=1 FL=1|tara:strand:+ start:581 stop:3904 length:3324 start_codon:yes stop_codon:yes gene_type:complete